MLIRSRKFLPYFITQALGALNDNVFKNVVVLLFTYNIANLNTTLSTGEVANLAAGLFILPFALFSGLGGYIADNSDKAKLIKHLKLTELLIMLLASSALWFDHFPTLLGCVFLMGTQSAFFGPVKYSIMPAALPKRRLMKANAWVEMSTFLMILLGTIFAGILASKQSLLLIIPTIIVFSLIGLISSLFVPSCPPTHKKKWHYSILWSSYATAFFAATQKKAVWLSILGISWFWFIGALVLAQLPSLAKNYLALNELGLTWLLALFSIGIGSGSIVCEKLAKERIEIGLVPLGAIGISTFLYLTFAALPTQANPLQPITSLWANPEAINTGIMLTLTGFAGGLYIVPLYAYIQTRAPKNHIASVIAANNILNAALMVVSALLGFISAKLGFPTPWLILFAALFNVVVAIYTYTLSPEFLWRFIVWVLVHTIYRFRIKNKHHLPAKGPAILVCNHIGYSDAAILFSSSRRPLRFVMDHNIFNNKLLGWFFRTAQAIPIAPKHENETLYENAFIEIEKTLNRGEVLVIFPEGKLTKDGEIGSFKNGLLKVLEKTPVPVVPMALGGLWGSVFSRKHSNPLIKVYKGLFFIGRKIDLVIGQPIAAEHVDMEKLRQVVNDLRTRP